MATARAMYIARYASKNPSLPVKAPATDRPLTPRIVKGVSAMIPTTRRQRRPVFGMRVP
jgi:hypothetical protein